MSPVARFEIAGRRYELVCREGEQAHYEALGRTIDAKARLAGEAVRGLTETRQLLLAALLLADEVHDARARIDAGETAAPDPAADLAPIVDRLAERIEKLAGRLEEAAGSA